MTKLSALVTLILTLAFAISPALTDPFSGFEANQLPIPQIDPPVQPAGYAFSVWGLIYSWLIVSAFYGLFKRADAADWNRARLPLGFSLAVGVPWLAIANASAIWATITIILMAIGAIGAMILAPSRDRWLFQAPVGIYAGWLTAASCVSIGTTMAGYGILTDAFTWAFIGISIGLVTAMTVFLKARRAPEYLLTVVWALIGIIVANGTELLSVSIVAAVGAFTLSILAFTKPRINAAN
jgi:hypothetical protein